MTARSVGGETSQTLDRGLAVLELLARADRTGGWTVTELAAELGVGRPVIYRLVASLGAHELAARGEDGRIRLGLGAGRIAGAVLPVLRATAMPVLRALADDLGVTAHLTVAEHDAAYALAVVEPRVADMHVGYRVGTRHPLDAGAAGRAIIAGREAGWSEPQPEPVRTSGELQPGAHGLAAPVLGLPGIEASVGVVALTELDRPEYAARVLRAADDLRRAAG